MAWANQSACIWLEIDKIRSVVLVIGGPSIQVPGNMIYNSGV